MGDYARQRPCSAAIGLQPVWDWTNRPMGPRALPCRETQHRPIQLLLPNQEAQCSQSWACCRSFDAQIKPGQVLAEASERKQGFHLKSLALASAFGA